MLPQQHYTRLKTPLILALGTYNSKTARWNFFLLTNFDKQYKMQIFGKVFWQSLKKFSAWGSEQP